MSRLRENAPSSDPVVFPKFARSELRRTAAHPDRRGGYRRSLAKRREALGSWYRPEIVVRGFPERSVLLCLNLTSHSWAIVLMITWRQAPPPKRRCFSSWPPVVLLSASVVEVHHVATAAAVFLTFISGQKRDACGS